jgi:hypothetical protein
MEIDDDFHISIYPRIDKNKTNEIFQGISFFEPAGHFGNKEDTQLYYDYITE